MKSPDKTVFEGSEVEEIGKEKDISMHGIIIIDKIESRDDNFFKDAIKDGDMDDNFFKDVFEGGDMNANSKGRDMGVINDIKAGMQKEKKDVKVLVYIVTEEKGDVEQQKKEQDFGRLDSIAKIESRDDNFFEDVYGERLEDKVLVLRFKFHMAKAPGHIITEEKGDAEQQKKE